VAPTDPIQAVDFRPSLAPLYAAQLSDLTDKLETLAGLRSSEVEPIRSAAAETIQHSLHRKLCRVLVVELNGARERGALRGATPEERWNDFMAASSTPEFWESIAGKYPTLHRRISRAVAYLCDAVLAFAQHWSADRHALADLLGAPAGDLNAVSFGAGDVHRQGRSVAIVSCDGGKIVYKPRSLCPEILLARLIEDLERECGHPLFMRTPPALDRGGHGWAAFIEHAYAAGPDDLKAFYRGIGGWLALTRLLGATDLHAENLIAHQTSPVLIDCETLFTPKTDPRPTGLGEAVDRAMRLVSGTVIASGLLPNRGDALGWRGVDVSGIGALPGQQPMITLPDLVDAGTDRAHIGSRTIAAEPAQNHPAPEPGLADHWPDILKAFDDVSALLRRLDKEGRLAPLLAPFATCEIRVVTRATEVYAELARMLWHPISLHKEDEARERARDLLTRMAANLPSAPADPQIVDAEIDDLMVGDIPYFATRPDRGRLVGPGGHEWLDEVDLIEAAMADWRATDLKLEHEYVRSTLVNAYVNDASTAQVRQLPAILRHDDLDLRRRRHAAAIMQGFIDSAVLGVDGTVTWVASTLTPTGWSLQPLPADLYGGLSGVALVTAAYQREQRAARADIVPGVDDLLQRLVRSLGLFEEQQAKEREDGRFARPPPPGGYLGLGSQIWTRLVLARWGCDEARGLAAAVDLAGGLPSAVAADEMLDVLEGRAGAIPALVALAGETHSDRFLELARAIGDALLDLAQAEGNGLVWKGPLSPQGVGGFAHGATGIGWALAKLGAAAAEPRYIEAAAAAFRFEESLFDEEEQNWLDLRMLQGTTSSVAWCHGCVGIGLAHVDLDPTLSDPAARAVVERAARATDRLSFGWNRCACHGDVGAWEFLQRAGAAGAAPQGTTPERLLSIVLASLEEYGPGCGSTGGAFQPGLLAGQGGVLYQLLKSNAESDLPSFLTLSLPNW
jgi:type 2 lantibiotic biosynthesis protein LanM